MASNHSRMMYCVVLLPLKFVILFWDKCIYGKIMLYMSLGLAVVLLLWAENCIGYLKYSHLVSFSWSLPSNVGRSSLKPRSFSSSWFTLKVRKILQPHPWPPWSTSPCSRSKWIRTWKNAKTSSHHLLGYLCTVRSIIPSIWPQHTATQWAILSSLSIIKWGYQASVPRTSPQWAHTTQIITLWNPNHACAE